MHYIYMGKLACMCLNTYVECVIIGLEHYSTMVTWYRRTSFQAGSEASIILPHILILLYV